MSDKQKPNDSNRDYISSETLLKLSKEIAVKFIEVGRITPSSFDECFRDIYSTLESTVKEK